MIRLCRILSTYVQYPWYTDVGVNDNMIRLGHMPEDYVGVVPKATVKATERWPAKEPKSGVFRVSEPVLIGTILKGAV